MSESDNKMSGDDRTLNMVARARDGDQEAVNDLYRLYAERLRGAVNRNLGGRLRAKMESDDLIQSVWKDVLSDMKDFDYRGSDSFFKWLSFRILRKIADKGRFFAAGRRDMKRETPGDGDSPGQAAARSTGDPSPSQAAVAGEELNRLMRLLGHLPDPQRQALVLRTRDNMRFEEIAKVMGRSAGAVRQLHNRALIKVNELMRKENGPEGGKD
jgi:RNA polymerase sigma-70 factor, ECF subfamily